MSNTIKTLKTKILGRRSNDEADSNRLSAEGGTDMTIGTPTNVKRLIHAETDENGILRGLPPEYEKMLGAMMSAEERMNPDNAKRAKNVIIFFQREEEKKEQPGFIRSEFMSIGSSGESTASAGGSSSGRNSSEDDVAAATAAAAAATAATADSKRDSGRSTFYVDKSDTPPQKQTQQKQEEGAVTVEEKTESNRADNSGNANNSPELDNRVKEMRIKDDQANANTTNSETTSTETVTKPTAAPRPSLGKIAVESAKTGEGEATLRRKAGAGGSGGGPRGPRVTRNITEEEVYKQINLICSGGHPLDRYDRDIELGSGAAGTVFLALDKKTNERVAIKIIDLQKQPKKEMILMELKVRQQQQFLIRIQVCRKR